MRFYLLSDNFIFRVCDKVLSKTSLRTGTSVGLWWAELAMRQLGVLGLIMIEGAIVLMMAVLWMWDLVLSKRGAPLRS